MSFEQWSYLDGTAYVTVFDKNMTKDNNKLAVTTDSFKFNAARNER